LPRRRIPRDVAAIFLPVARSKPLAFSS